MKRILLLILILGVIFLIYFISVYQKDTSPIISKTIPTKIEFIKKERENILLGEALRLLKIRKDQDALLIFEKILAKQPDNLDALWGMAEAKRRARQYKESEDILNEILKKNPQHSSSLISLAYIRYKDDRLNDAFQLVNRVLENGYLDEENKALAHMMLGTINSKRAKKGSLFCKIKYGNRIKSYFLKARELAPALPEVHLGLGTFYLLAPTIAGGNLDKAVKELELAVKIAPDFATACARLAQCYKRKDIQDKYEFYIARVKTLDPENEVLKEIK